MDGRMDQQADTPSFRDEEDTSKKSSRECLMQLTSFWTPKIISFSLENLFKVPLCRYSKVNPSLTEAALNGCKGILDAVNE